ncbi:TPA: hypothetical protein DEP30_01865 [Candidatus Nomurabacteria bacterium]|nr:MAG: hypothetical protein UR97_C0001G0051 [Candidatus Nomurabacteria bacterium GW2011_GWE2_36_115]KKP94354.1 MAG: hypothetical protein US00_C0002G0050 [Candidatus Nomurabacteria bacterium GW2011_GWF2_36_126]KKP96820.1 MAG: hypothetical protein US04_C0001G0323 [Candidatus Nomurabacteria bacterium GW2011_GWD2_36_14]KKP99576.1 MAG: hypothetical protein US08_C0001G0258 [Candidatus Nomurabacteria bacterium GW2011_GWF2_36_19]KKQ05572.1 MAG: hypothetical protein US17_C0003G0051 [Candidatus Nomuraba
MKNDLFNQLRTEVTNYRQAIVENERLKQQKQEKIEREKERKKIEKQYKNFDQTLLSWAKSGHDYYVVEIILSGNLSESRSGAEIEDWPLHEQEVFHFLEKEGYRPEIIKRDEGDLPLAYSPTEAPYAIVVVWK